MDAIKKTQETYSFLWTRSTKVTPPGKWHFNAMQEVISEPIVRGKIGIDIGSGCGYDTYIMAKDNPSVRIISADISDGVYGTKKLTSRLENVQVVKCSVSDMPTKSSIFDFAYSFGVLHHVPSLGESLLEIARILKKNTPVFLYLYEDHSEDFMKNAAIKFTGGMRKITIKMPRKFIYVLSWIFSPFIFIFFSIPANFLKRFKKTQCFSDKIPFNFGTSFFSLRGDLYDRFSAPIEHRFSKHQIYALFAESGFRNVDITKLKRSAGWVAWGYKK